MIYSNIILKDSIQSNKKVAFPAQNPCTTAKKYYGFGMDTETLALIKKLEATNAAMDQLAIEVQKQCQAHISDLEKSMADQSLFFEGRFTSKPPVILQKS